jgi:hypothetical protein
MLILLTLLPFEIALLWYTLKRSGFVPFPHLQLTYMIGAQVSIYLVADHIVKYNFLRTYSSYAFEEHYIAAQMLFALIFLFTFLMFKPAPNIRFAAGLRRALQARPATFGVLVLVLVLWMYHIMVIFVVNRQAMWLNHTYLLMNDYRILSIDNAMTRFLMTLFPFVGFIVFAFFAVYVSGRQRYVAFALFPLALFDYLYQAGAHSRKAVMYLLVFAIISLLLKRNKAVIILTVGASIFTLMFCLGGRNYGDQGLSTFAETGDILATYAKINPADGFLNIFEGAFVTTEVFSRHHESATIYKILSFSPFPSIIDGFSKIRASNLHKLGRYAPPSAILEAWSFGFFYVVLLVLPQVIAGKMVVRLIGRGNSAVAVSANMLMAFASYIQFTYPVRTVYRLFLITLVLATLGTFAERLLRHNRRKLGGAYDVKRQPASLNLSGPQLTTAVQ